MAYELMYIVRPTVDEQTLASVNEKVDKFITSAGGSIVKRDDWGKRLYESWTKTGKCPPEAIAEIAGDAGAKRK